MVASIDIVWHHVNIDDVSDRLWRLTMVACCRQAYKLRPVEHYSAIAEAMTTAERVADNKIQYEEVAYVHTNLRNMQRQHHDWLVSANLVALNDFGSSGYSKSTTLESCLRCLCKFLQLPSDSDIFNNTITDIMLPHFKYVKSIKNIPNNPTIIRLAETAYYDHDFSLLPILGDALEDAGCTDVNVLMHCRSAQPHYRGCWVLDRLLKD